MIETRLDSNASPFVCALVAAGTTRGRAEAPVGAEVNSQGRKPLVLAHLLPDRRCQGHSGGWIVVSATMDSLNVHSARKFLQ